MLSLALALGGVLAACETTPDVNLEVSTGQEKGVFELDPRIVNVEVKATSAEQDVRIVATAEPGGAFDLGDVPDSKILSFDVSGFAADGSVVARGRSLGVLIGALKDGTLPLFLERLGGWSRPLGALDAAHVEGATGVLGERYLMLTGGSKALAASGDADAKGVQFYDLLAQAPATSGTDLPRAARSLVMLDNRALVIDDAGATWVDFDGSELPYDVEPPVGMTFADVAGGAVIENAAGATYVVGATRSAGPTDKVLVVGADGLLSVATLTAARVGAAAAYATQGLVVAGGSADADGVEIMPDGKPSAPLSYPKDPTEGAALAIAPNDKMILAGGRAAGAASETRIIDLRCVSDCGSQVQILGDAPIASIARRARAFAVTNGAVLVGDDVDGVTHSFRITLTPQAAIELPLREPRKGASVVAAPNGTLAILGGELVSGGPATSVEQLFPE